MGNKKFIFLFSLVCCSLLLFYELIYAESKPISKGAQFPNFTFKDILCKESQTYLGISRKTNFSFKDIQGTLFIIEVFNTYCFSCPKNVPILNDVYSAIESDPKLKGKVKVISIAIGNTQNEVKSYIKEHGVLYPILTDMNFDIYKALGNPRVPYTIFMKRDAKGKNKVIHTHQSILESTDIVMKQVKIFF